MNAQQEVVSFKIMLEKAERKCRNTENYVACAQCGRTIYRNRYRRKRNTLNFCSQECQGVYRHQNRKTKPNLHNVFTSRITKYHQRAFGVSLNIAKALQTGEYPSK